MPQVNEYSWTWVSFSTIIILILTIMKINFMEAQDSQFYNLVLKKKEMKIII